MEGYLSMLVGQQVPYKYQFQPAPRSEQNWQQIQQAIKNKVTTAFTVREGLSMVRSSTLAMAAAASTRQNAGTLHM